MTISDFRENAAHSTTAPDLTEFYEKGIWALTCSIVWAVFSPKIISTLSLYILRFGVLCYCSGTITCFVTVCLYVNTCWTRFCAVHAWHPYRASATWLPALPTFGNWKNSKWQRHCLSSWDWILGSFSSTGPLQRQFVSVATRSTCALFGMEKTKRFASVAA